MLLIIVSFLIMDRYTIGQLAKAAGVPTSTIRYYERRGLVLPVSRSEGNYRLFDYQGLDRLRFVRSAQGAGFTLSDIATLLALKEDQSAPCDEVQDLISLRLDHVVEQIEHLKAVEGMLRDWMEVCQGAQSSGWCGVLVGLQSEDQNKCAKSGKIP